MFQAIEQRVVWPVRVEEVNSSGLAFPDRPTYLVGVYRQGEVSTAPDRFDVMTSAWAWTITGARDVHEVESWAMERLKELQGTEFSVSVIAPELDFPVIVLGRDPLDPSPEQGEPS